jgi:hypothetical protein
VSKVAGLYFLADTIKLSIGAKLGIFSDFEMLCDRQSYKSIS